MFCYVSSEGRSFRDLLVSNQEFFGTVILTIMSLCIVCHIGTLSGVQNRQNLFGGVDFGVSFIVKK